jgi:hypothetical protein
MGDERMKNPVLVVLFTLSSLFSCVVHATPNPRYEINGGEVYDKDSNLTWQRCSVGQAWKDGAGCVGKLSTFTFQDAQRETGGKWRVPNREELAGLIDHSHEDFPTIDADAFPGMSQDAPTYWSSTSSNSERAWDVRFTVGNVSDDVVERKYALRLVRSGK